MALIGIKGNSQTVNTSLLLYAKNRAPSFVVDCADSARPHTSFDHDNVFVARADLLYVFRRLLERLPSLMENMDISKVMITTFDNFVDMDDEEMMEHAWVLISKLAVSNDVVVGISERQEGNARKYCHQILDADAFDLSQKIEK